MATTTTTNMSITLPIDGTESGTWGPYIIDAIDDELDTHDHSSGKGVQITPAGMNINADLDVNSNDLDAVRSMRMDSQGAALAVGTDIRCVYSVSGDLYYNNGSGTSIQITSGSSINTSAGGGIGGDYGTSDGNCTYSDTTKVFTFVQSAGVHAIGAFSDIHLHEGTSGSNTVTVKVGSTPATATVTIPDTTGTLATLANLAQSFLGATTFSNTVTVGVDDTGHDVTFFGATASAKMLWDESADTLISKGGVANPGRLTLQTAETTVVDGDKLGQIDFQAPDEASGTDAILAGASIWAEADATFDASTNTTDLVFAVGTSEAAAESMRLTPTGLKLITQAFFAAKSITYDATQDWDLEDAQVATVTLTGNTTFDAPTNIKAGGYYAIFITQDGTGSRTAAYNSVFKWPGGAAPTLTTTASATDLLCFMSPDGTNLYGISQLAFS